MGRKKSFTTFQLSFIGEQVEMVVSISGNQGEEGMPLIINGFLLDMDDTYFYVGNTPNAISQCVVKEDVRLIAIVEEINELEEVLKSVPTPKNKEEGN